MSNIVSSMGSVYLDGDFLGDNFLGEKLKELFFFAGAVATPPRATSQA